MKKIPDIINRLWNVCGQMEVGTLLTCGSGIIRVTFTQSLRVRIRTEKNGANQSVKLNLRLRIEPCTHGFRSGLIPRFFLLQLSADRSPGPSRNFYFSVSFLYLYFFFLFQEDDQIYELFPGS